MNVKMKMSAEKYCTLPGLGRHVRCASTEGGHVCVIGPTPRHIPQAFIQEALGQGVITETHLERLKQGMSDNESPFPVLALAPVSSTPGMADGERFARIVAAMTAIIDAGKVEDFTQQGIVKVEAVSASTGFLITATERDTAFAEIKKG